MPMPRAPFDPYCRLNGKGSRVTEKDADADLAALAAYARAHGVSVWRYRDDKLALTSEHYAKTLARGQRGDLAPLVFGSEGAPLPRTAAEAMSALREQSANLTAAIRAREKVTGQVDASRLDPIDDVPEPTTIIDRARPGAMTQTTETFLRDRPTLDEPARDTTGWRWLGANKLAAVESALRGLGKPGARLADLFQRRNEMVARLQATAFTRLNAQLERLTPEEIASGYANYVEKGIVPDETRRAVLESVYQSINDIDEQFYTGLAAQGVTVAPRVGAGTLNPTGRYFPHRRDLSALGDPNVARLLVDEVKARAQRDGNVQLSDDEALDLIHQMGWGDVKRERAIDKMIEAAARREAKLDRGDAARLFDQIVEGADRISGSLERERKLHFGGYITDMRRAYTATWTRNAYRLADVTVLGQKDARVHQALEEMRYRPELGARAVEFSQRVVDLELGRNQLKMSKIGRELYGWQAAKLSLALLANSTQGLNTFMRTGLMPFAKAVRDGIVHARDFSGVSSPRHERSTVATRSGALPTKLYQSDATLQLMNTMLDDTRERGAGAIMGVDRALGQRVGNAADLALDTMLTPFRWVENWNRSVAQRAGEYYFDQIVHQLQTKGAAGLQSQKIGGRIRELDLTPERVLEMVQRGDADGLREVRTLAGLRVSNETQFRSDYQSMPLYANDSEMGRFFFQYKNFAINQSRFMLRELSPAVAKRDPARAIRALATITLAYPGVGILLTSMRQDLMGPTIAGTQLSEALDDPSVASIVQAGAVAMVLTGGLGILADVGMTAALGNDFSMRNFFVPPAASSIANGWQMIGSVGRGIVNADSEELLKFRTAFLREFGGVGATVEERLRRGEGRSEEPENLAGQVGRVLF